MNTNPRNFGIVIGHLGRDPKIFNNRDGSKKVLMSLAVRQNYKNAEGKRGTDWVDLEAFIPASAKNSNGVYALLKTGTMIEVAFTVVTNTYVDSKGENQRKQVLRVTNIELLSSRRTNDTAENEVQPAMATPETVTADTGAYQAPMPQNIDAYAGSADAAPMAPEFDAYADPDGADFTEFNA